MNNQLDPRVAELAELAQSHGFELPYPADFICWLEDRGKIVNLLTGEVWDNVSAEPTPSGVAVAHLLTEYEGELAL